MTKCSGVMTPNPVCCYLLDTVEKAAQLMQTENVGSVPVVETHENKLLRGIVTDRDLALKIIAEQRDPANTTIEEVMTLNPVTCRPEDDLEDAMKKMADHQVRRIPVVNEKNQIVGIIAQADVALRTNDQKTGDVVEDISKP